MDVLVKFLSVIKNEDSTAIENFIIQNASRKCPKSGNTLIFWIIQSKDLDENECYQMTKLLIKNKIDINVLNNLEQTPLFTAAFYKRHKVVELLLKEGATLLNTKFNELHTIAANGDKTILATFLKDNRCTQDYINQVDKDDETPLFKAAYYGHKECAELLICKGANLLYSTPEGVTTIDIIFQHVPEPGDFFYKLMNTKISISQDKKCYLIDFTFLTAHTERQMDLILNIIEADDCNYEEIREVLQHPLIELFVGHKWSKIRMFFYTWIVIYTIFIMSLWLYSSLLFRNAGQNQRFLLTARLLLMSTSCGLFIHCILQFVLSFRNALKKFDMWINLLCTSLALILTAHESKPNDIKNMPNWVLQATSIAILLAFTKLMLLLGTLPTFGYYTLMFQVVLKNVLKVLSAYFCLILGFSLSFSIQFYDYNQFEDPWRAFLKTTVMMMGEFDYDGLFDDNGPSHMPSTSRFIFLLFVIIISIVLMNLMIGIAVSDIQELQEESHARKIEKQSLFIGQLEKLIYSKQLPGIIKKFLIKLCYVEPFLEINVRQAHGFSSKLRDTIEPKTKGRDNN